MKIYLFLKLSREDFHETMALQLWFVRGGRLYNCWLREELGPEYWPLGAEVEVFRAWTLVLGSKI